MAKAKKSIRDLVRQRHLEKKNSVKQAEEEERKQLFFEKMNRRRALLRQLRALKELTETVNHELNEWNDQNWSRWATAPDEWKEEIEAEWEIEDENA